MSREMSYEGLHARLIWGRDGQLRHVALTGSHVVSGAALRGGFSFRSDADRSIITDEEGRQYEWRHFEDCTGADGTPVSIGRIGAMLP